MLHVASVLHFHLRHWPGWRQCRASRPLRLGPKHTTDDLEDREISAAGIHGFYPKRACGGGAGRGTEKAFRYGLPKHHSGFERREAGGSRRSEVSKSLRGGWHEARELSSVRPRVDGERKRLRERRTGTAVGLRF